MIRKTSVHLADGRALHYYGTVPAKPSDYPDRRPLPPLQVESEARWDRLLGEWVVVASHRQERTFLPGDDQCPLCPSADGRQTEIPAPDYEVVAFENRFPTLGADDGGDPTSDNDATLIARPAGGRCEIVCFSPRHDASFADLSVRQTQLVLAAWTDRTLELAQLPQVEQVFCFENRGAEIGATLSHPHGQIYAYPYLTPRTDRMLRSCAAYRAQTDRNLFDDVLEAETAGQSRIVMAGRHWVAFVPFAAHWPYEVHLYPLRRVPDLAAVSDDARDEFCVLYLDLLNRFNRLFGGPAPYISAWHQAPVRAGRDDFALHLELFTIRRSPDKLKYLAGSESGMGAFANDIAPENAAEQLRQLGPAASSPVSAPAARPSKARRT